MKADQMRDAQQRAESFNADARAREAESEAKRQVKRAEAAEESAALFGHDMREFAAEARYFAEALLLGHPYCLKWATDLPKMTGPWPAEWAAHAECESEHVYALFMGEKFPPLVKAREYGSDKKQQAEQTS